MPQQQKSETPAVPKRKPKRAAAESAELSDRQLDQVSGGKLPGKHKPPTLTLKRG